jgi:hypothetical protein
MRGVSPLWKSTIIISLLFLSLTLNQEHRGMKVKAEIENEKGEAILVMDSGELNQAREKKAVSVLGHFFDQEEREMLDAYVAGGYKLNLQLTP